MRKLTKMYGGTKDLEAVFIQRTFAIHDKFNNQNSDKELLN